MTSQTLSSKQRRVVIFGPSGLIGSELLRKCPDAIGLPWSEIRRDCDIARRLDPGTRYDFIFAGGITDPKRPRDEIFEANLEFPKRVIQEVAERGSDRFIALGTILEEFTPPESENAYRLSKLELSRWIAGLGVRGRILHLRLHTVYGPKIKGHFFLGQMLDALRTGTPFRMSSGEQLREYHHVADIAEAIHDLRSREWDFGPILEINSGNPIRLAALARAVFKAFQREDLLKIGEIPAQADENTSRSFPRSPGWLLPKARDPVEGVIGVLRELLDQPLDQSCE